MKAKEFLCHLVPDLAALALLVSADQISKRAASSGLTHPVELLPGVLELRFIMNSGAAFGMLENQTAFFIITAAFVIAAGLLFLAKLPGTKRYFPLRNAVVVLLAGALGNLVDRAALGRVRDFIYFKLIDFPVFNLADIYVTVSCACLFILIMTRYREDHFDFLKKN